MEFRTKQHPAGQADDLCAASTILPVISGSLVNDRHKWSTGSTCSVMFNVKGNKTAMQ